jgi:ATP-binding cassette subfamily B protein
MAVARVEPPASRTPDRLLASLALEVWAFRPRVLTSIVLLLAAKLAAVAVPMILKRIVDVLSRPEAVAALPIALLAGYAAVRFSTTLFGELRDLVFARVTESTVGDFKLRVFRHLHQLGARFHSERATGALTRDVERGTAAIGFIIGVSLFTIIPTVVEIAAVLGIMIASYGAAFSSILGGTFVLYASLTALLIARRAARQRVVNDLDSLAQRRLVDSLLNYETIKFYTNEDFESRRLQTIVDDGVEAAVSSQKALTLLHIGQSAVIALGVASVMLLAGSQVLNGALTVGDLVLVNAYVIQICLPLNSLGYVLRESTDAVIRAERLAALLRLPAETEPESAHALLARGTAEIHFAGVTFGYEPNRPVVSEIDFKIAPGQTVAVVGGSGSGKSTLVRLLLRFVDPWSGRISIDGEDVRTLTRASVRAAIGIVPQDTTLFNDTIEHNIAYGRVGATHDEIVAAARAANVHDFIDALPEQYATMVGERGLKLSGGEKQRIAIARAILKDPPILVLDEATSALDTRNERAIRLALERLAEPRTTLVIAHRLSTVVNADEILVLESGRIVERGRHLELLDRDGLYAQLWSLQRQERELRRTKRQAVLQPVSLQTLVSDAIGAAGPEIEAKGINLYTRLGNDIGLVTGDATALRDIVWDLLEHSIEISETGARIEIDLERVGNEIALRVTDLRALGEHGAAAESRPISPVRKFDPGTVRVVLEEHQGRLAIEAVHPAGTAYTIALPVRAVAPVPEVAPPPRIGGEPLGPSSFAGRSVVVVDDDEDAREALRMLLALHSADVHAFDSGRAVLDYLRQRTRADWPDLMICDIGLRGEDGYSVLRRVRGFEAEQRVPLAERMPAIALTGFARPEDRVHALTAGFQVHLAKPALPNELLATIGRLLGLGAAAH